MGTGYGGRRYVETVAPPERIVEVPRCGGLLVRRPIPGSDRHDVANAYPLFRCADVGRLADDVASLDAGPVSVTLVIDPLLRADPTDLLRGFEVVREFKQHFVVRFASFAPSRHHRRDARRALRHVEVICAGDVEPWADDWLRLYRRLGRRHTLSAGADFGEESLRRQLMLPSMRVYVARRGGAACAMALWYVDGGVAHYHLAAADDEGYRLGAAYALMLRALDDLAALGLSYASLGAGAGYGTGDGDGLARFKAGWSNLSLPAYLCGRVLDHAAYAALAASGAAGSATARSAGYFPAYRAPPGYPA